MPLEHSGADAHAVAVRELLAKFRREDGAGRSWPAFDRWVCGEMPQASKGGACVWVQLPDWDARLIASAPELLAALEDMTDRYARAMKDSGVSHYPEAMVEIRSARAAIARATGGAA